ncbi:unnamed protein product [marine sediment metagenome]|uniref:Uncharacterized protein n=1 Tax=marine sediment metagenome TaxID=412755 RepID=X1TKJ6_9ZZZZ
MVKFRGPGNTWQKEKEELRLDCWWKGGNIGDKRFIYERYTNGKNLEDIEAMTEKESKSEGFLNGWWASLELGSKRKREGKKFIYWAIVDPLTPEEKIPILEYTQKSRGLDCRYRFPLIWSICFLSLIGSTILITLLPPKIYFI